MSYIQSFCRYEKKYLINSEQYEKFERLTKDIISPDEYGKYTICNIYLDTEDYSFIRNSIERPPYKEKLRVRSYGVTDGNSNAFFEIKKKFDGIVYKRRISAKEKDIEEYALTGNASESLLEKANPQILSEIDYIMHSVCPIPKVYIAYDRQAFVGNEYPDLRITFDSNIRSRMDDLHLSCGDSGKLLDVALTDERGRTYTDKDYRIMEIKTDASVPANIAGILSELKIFPSSFSKYGEIYKQIILPEELKKGSAAVC